jgi:hypothetical protein
MASQSGMVKPSLMTTTSQGKKFSGEKPNIAKRGKNVPKKIQSFNNDAFSQHAIVIRLHSQTRVR